MIYDMADLNQFQRSKDRLLEVLYHLTREDVMDSQTMSYIKVLEASINTLDLKIEEFKARQTPGSVSSYELIY
jgi:hypothetical protein